MSKAFETQRLIFREIIPSDAEGIYELDSNPEVHLYLGNNPVTSMEQCHAVIEHITKQYEKNGIGRWAVILKETCEFIGWAGLKLESNVNGHEQFYDIGYRFIQKHWGKGYAGEAAQAWVNYGFNVMKLEKINATVNAENLASKKVLEKAGLKFVEAFDEEGVPTFWYEMKNPNL